MNTFSKVLAAGVVSVVAAGSAFAGEASDYRQEHNLLPNVVSTHAYAQNVSSVARLSGDNGVTIRSAKQVLGLNDAAGNRIPGSSASDLSALRADASQNQAVVEALAARNLTASDLAGSYTALNGKTVYIVR